jgi:glutamate formiminotransferase
MGLSVKSGRKRFIIRGAIPTTVSYNASVVKIYNSTSSLVRFENKTISFYFEETLLWPSNNAGVVVVKSKVVGLVPAYAFVVVN